MRPCVARDVEVRCAGRGMRPQHGVIDGMSRFSRVAAGPVVSAHNRSVGRAGRMFPGWDNAHSRDVETLVGANAAAADATPAEGSLSPKRSNGSR